MTHFAFPQDLKLTQHVPSSPRVLGFESYVRDFFYLLTLRWNPVRPSGTLYQVILCSYWRFHFELWSGIYENASTHSNSRGGCYCFSVHLWRKIPLFFLAARRVVKFSFQGKPVADNVGNSQLLFPLDGMWLTQRMVIGPAESGYSRSLQDPVKCSFYSGMTPCPEDFLTASPIPPTLTSHTLSSPLPLTLTLLPLPLLSSLSVRPALKSDGSSCLLLLCLLFFTYSIPCWIPCTPNFFQHLPLRGFRTFESCE